MQIKQQKPIAVTNCVSILTGLHRQRNPGRSGRQHPRQNKSVDGCNGLANQDHFGPDHPTHKGDGQQRERTERRWRRQWQWPWRRKGQRTSQMQDSPIHQAVQHGLLLFVALFPSSWQEPHKRNLSVVTTQPRCDGNTESQKSGRVHWPLPICVSIEQQSHAT